MPRAVSSRGLRHGQIIEEDCHVKLTDEDAWESARNLLRFSAACLDVTVERERERAGLPRRTMALKMEPPAPRPPPVPRLCPIDLLSDHYYEVRSNLALVKHEVSRVKTHPSSWRWAVVAMYNALGHALARRHKAEPKHPLHHLLELFDVVALKTPAIKKSRPSVEQLEMLRTTWVCWGVSEWPVDRKALPTLVEECRRALRRLEGLRD